MIFNSHFPLWKYASLFCYFVLKVTKFSPVTNAKKAFPFHLVGKSEEETLSVSPTFYEQRFCVIVFWAPFRYQQFGKVIFWQRKSSQKLLIKCLWNWLKVEEICAAPILTLLHLSPRRRREGRGGGWREDWTFQNIYQNIILSFPT